MHEHLTRATRQHLETDQLLGVDFVPLRANGTTATKPDRPDRPDGPAAVAGRGNGSEAPHGGHRAVADKQAALDAVLERYRQSPRCVDYCRTNPQGKVVFGEGHPNAALMFIGEAPGADEERTGRPFVGRAGQKLDDIIRAMKLSREEVYIANVLKCRPPNNRTPQPDEVADESPFLREQIEIIDPQVIVTLGGPATKLLLETSEGITRLRGRWATYTLPDGRTIPVMPTFHPAYLLRNYTAETRAAVWSDMQKVMQRLDLR